ncbi:MAG: amidohydrolase [Xanthomonadales bacterium]|nr:amidohydrolase [Xanthomonadales bacterium]
MVMSYKSGLAILFWLTIAWPVHAIAAEPPADTAYRNGKIYTVDARNSTQESLAVRDGKIVYVGADTGAGQFIGPGTQVIDLGGRMMMPGLVDGHMHPLSGGMKILGCSLNYAALTIAQFQARIQACIDASRDKGPDDWLEVESWFQQNMLPAGTEVSREDLDMLQTQRPILVRSSFGHSTLASSRAMELANITADTADPEAGKIAHNAAGQPTGILEDSAQALFDHLLPQTTDAEMLAAAQASLEAVRAQGITTFLDASADARTVAAYAALQRDGKLTVRAHFAMEITPEEGRKPEEAVAALVQVARQFDQGPVTVQPTITVRNAKLYMDGVITAPAFTGVMLQPYLVNQGTAEQPNWISSGNTGPAPYFSAEVLRELLLQLAAAGIDPHIHADGDGATRYALDGFAAMREKYSGEAIRAAIAHDEIVDPADFPRFALLDVIPVLSLQWGKPASDTIEGARDYLGPARFKYLEPQGFLHEAGARIAYGSDWPVDPLDEWFALKVGVTRANDPSAGPQYAGRLSDDPGLSRETAIRTITINSSYELHQEAETGSLEVGKLADLIILDRNLFEIPAEEIADVQVLLTVVGGKVVYQSDAFD